MDNVEYYIENFTRNRNIISNFYLVLLNLNRNDIMVFFLYDLLLFVIFRRNRSYGYIKLYHCNVLLVIITCQRLF